MKPILYRCHNFIEMADSPVLKIEIQLSEVCIYIYRFIYLIHIHVAIALTFSKNDM